MLGSSPTLLEHSCPRDVYCQQDGLELPNSRKCHWDLKLLSNHCQWVENISLNHPSENISYGQNGFIFSNFQGEHKNGFKPAPRTSGRTYISNLKQHLKWILFTTPRVGSLESKKVSRSCGSRPLWSGQVILENEQTSNIYGCFQK